ncbi:hypothetical protein AB0J14_04315 [Micromonospora arborensis]|uniref:hypothetical protein n=1 Tax=Micromonospora arborensis TaxID=2116518 RepID=UPI0033F25E78
MSATTIEHPAGTAKPLLTMPGHYSVDLDGDWMPRIVEGRQHVLDLLDTRAKAKAAHQ